MSFKRFGRFVGLVALAVCSQGALAQTTNPNDVISGRWSLVVRTAEGTESRVLDLTLARDSSVSGSIASSLGSVSLSRGRLERNRLRFEFAMAGGEVRVAYDVMFNADTLRGVFRQDGYEGEVLGVRGERVVRFPSRGAAPMSFRGDDSNEG